MKINCNNYEAYFLDYIEGRLDAQSIAELKAFLSLHPQLNDNTIKFDYLSSENIEFLNKASLKKFHFQTSKIDNKNFDEFCIAWFEKLLPEEKSRDLFDYLDSNPSFREDFNRFKKTYLKPKRVAFNKHLLYKKTTPKRSSKSAVLWLSIAAGLALLVTVTQKFIGHKNNYIQNPLTITERIVLPNLSKASNNIKPLEKIKNKQNITLKNYYNNKLSNIIVSNTLINDTCKNGQIFFIKPLELTIIEINNHDNIQLHLSKGYDIPNNKNKRKNKLLVSVENFTKKITNIDRLKNKNGKISLIKIAQVGIKGINQITNSHMKLVEKTDTSGNVMALSFESSLFEYHKSKAN